MNNKISLREKVGYSLGDVAANLVFQMMMIFQLKFYTDIFGLDGAVAGSVLLVARIVDAFVDPAVGIITDRTRTRWGMYSFNNTPYSALGGVMTGDIRERTGDSHLLCYATGTSPYGPFRFRGELLQPVVGWTTHHSIVEWRGRTLLLHHDSQPSDGCTWLRSLKMAELTYDDDGALHLSDEQ